jgi:hypothetical protein
MKERGEVDSSSVGNALEEKRRIQREAPYSPHNLLYEKLPKVNFS